MNVIAEGKEAVLEHLEKETLERTRGKQGEYLLATDDQGNLIAMIAGRSFIGTGTIAFGGKTLSVSNGLVIDVA